MSRFISVSHSIWHCHYHIVWTPKYRFRILTGEVGKEVEKCIRMFSNRQGAIIVELNVVSDHVHLLVKIPPKVSVSAFVRQVKGRTAIRIFHNFPNLKKKPYWGNHFWAKGCCVDTVGVNAEMIQKYVKHQEQNEK